MKRINANPIDDESSEEEQDEIPEDDASEDDNNGELEEDNDEDGDELEDDEDEPPEASTPLISKPTPEAGHDKIALKNERKEITKKKPIPELVIDAIRFLKERAGSSIVAIKRVIMTNHPDMDERRLGLQIKRYIKSSVENGTMVQIKRSFRITKKHNEEQKKLKRAREKSQKEKQNKKTKALKTNQQRVNKDGEKANSKNANSKDANSKNANGKKANSKKDNDKENMNPSSGPTTSKGKRKPTKPTKPNEGFTKGLKKVSENAQTATTNNKAKSRKSISLVRKHTPPESSTKKKAKPAPTVVQKSRSKAENDTAGNSMPAKHRAPTSKDKRTKKQ